VVSGQLSVNKNGWQVLSPIFLLVAASQLQRAKQKAQRIKVDLDL
jgi:hypothetical protein